MSLTTGSKSDASDAPGAAANPHAADAGEGRPAGRRLRDEDRSDAHGRPATEVGSGGRRRPRRVAAPRAHYFFRWIFPLLLVGLAVAVVNLSLRAKDLVLESRDGNIVRTVDDPEAPGFFAEVVPTQTLLFIQTSNVGDLIGVAVMSLAAGESGGGSMMLLPRDLIVPLRSGGHEALSSVYGDGDQPALQEAVGYLIGSGVDTVANITPAGLAELIAPVAPLEYNVLDNVRERQGDRTVTILPKGQVSITSAEDIRAATEVLGPGEALVNLSQRQMSFWTAWFAAIRESPDSGDSPADVAPLADFVTTIGSGEARVIEVSFDESVYDGLTLLVANLDDVRAVAGDIIPYPQMAAPGDRLLAEVRNVVGTTSLNAPMSLEIAAAGGQVAVLSNADAFQPVDSTIIYYDAVDRERVEALADDLGIGRDHIEFTERPGSSIDVTVTIGADYVP